MRYKAKYLNGKIIEFKKYLPEGAVEYTLDDLKSDTAIYTNLGIPLKQNWKIIENSLVESEGGKQIKILKLDAHHFKEVDGDRIFITK